MKKIIIGARGSKLSSAYVSKVKNLLLQNYKDIDFEIKFIQEKELSTFAEMCCKFVKKSSAKRYP